MSLLIKDSTPSQGRYYAAAVDISAGKLLLEEKCVTSVVKNDFTANEQAFLVRCKHKTAPLSTILAYRVSLLNIQTQHSVITDLCHFHPNGDNEGMHECAQTLRVLNPSLSLADGMNLLRRISLNAFTITDDIMQPIGIAIFFQAARFNHSCHPNSTQSFFFKGKDVYLRIHANRSIKKGEQITISYIDLCFPTWWRREGR
jgi:hypothetical protein